MRVSNHHRVNLSDPYIDGVIHLARDDGRTVTLYDQGGPSSVPGLRLRIGGRSAAWVYVSDKVEKGSRVATYATLGKYDRGTRDEQPIRAPWHMNTKAAREAAMQHGASLVRGELPAHMGESFADVFAAYLDKLAAKAENNGKLATWRDNVKSLGAKYLLPKWGNWTLAEMSEKRQAVGLWYNGLARDVPSTAHHCRRIIRAMYNWQRRAGAKLPADNPALAPIERQEAYKTKPGRKALPRVNLDQFPQWLAEWRQLPTRMQRAYWLFLLFTGQRPGETLGIEWSGLDEKHGTLTVVNAKAGADIVVPLSDPIRRVLAMARDAAGKGREAESGLIFHGANAEHWSHREPPLDVPGHGMRRTFKTVAASLGLPNEMSGRLLGHSPEGVSAGYEDPLSVQRAAFLADMQAKVSAAIIGLLGKDPTREKFKPSPPSPREVARGKGAETYKSDQACPAGHTGLRYVSTNRCVACVADKNFRQKSNRVNWRRRHGSKRAAR